MDDRERLSRLDDLVLEAILSRSDEESLADLAPGDLNELDAAFSAGKAAHSRARMSRAKTAVAAQRGGVSAPSRTGIGRPATSKAPTVGRLMTLAARNGIGDHGDDQDGIDEDVAELMAEEGDDD